MTNKFIVGLFCKRALQKRPIFSKDLCTSAEYLYVCTTKKFIPTYACSHMYYRKVLQRSAEVQRYGVATISRLLKITDLFAEYTLFYRALLQKSPTKETFILQREV